MKIYIAGKITGLVYEDALRAFAEAAVELQRCGYEPVNPMAIETDPDLPWAEYMRRDIPHLLACDAIYLLETWKDSKGARLEKHIAEELGMLIVTAGFQGKRGEIFPACKDCGNILDENAGVFHCSKCRRELERFAKVQTKPEEWITCQADGCPERFIQTDPQAEVDLCPPCDAALMRVTKDQHCRKCGRALTEEDAPEDGLGICTVCFVKIVPSVNSMHSVAEGN